MVTQARLDMIVEACGKLAHDQKATLFGLVLDGMHAAAPFEPVHAHARTHAHTHARTHMQRHPHTKGTHTCTYSTCTYTYAHICNHLQERGRASALLAADATRDADA